MGQEEIDKKLKRANKKRELVSFKVEYKDKVVFEKKIELENFQEEVMENESFFYFFKDMSKDFEEKLLDAHKEIIWNKNRK